MWYCQWYGKMHFVIQIKNVCGEVNVIFKRFEIESDAMRCNEWMCCAQGELWELRLVVGKTLYVARLMQLSDGIWWAVNVNRCHDCARLVILTKRGSKLQKVDKRLKVRIRTMFKMEVWEFSVHNLELLLSFIIKEVSCENVIKT